MRTAVLGTCHFTFPVHTQNLGGVERPQYNFYSVHLTYARSTCKGTTLKTELITLTGEVFGVFGKKLEKFIDAELTKETCSKCRLFICTDRVVSCDISDDC